MTELNMTHLGDRGVVSVTGPDAAKLLQGLVTNDLALLETQAAVYAGLLSPQGKILFDFFIIRTPDGFLLETARDMAGHLEKRLAMYRLRADVEIRTVSADYTVAAFWGGPYQPEGNARHAIAYADPRLPEMGTRALIPVACETPPGEEPAAGGSDAATASADAYHAHRIALGVPQGGLDFIYGETFPHEALLDQLHGVAFDKGCYVGQEIVSRMEHRGTARKRIVPVVANTPLPSGRPDIKAGDVTIGTLGSTHANRGLALIRLDRAADMKAKGQELTSAGIPVEIEIPSWAKFNAHIDNPAVPT